MKRKSSYWQIIRAVCIMAVIMIHCPNALGMQHNDPQFVIYIILRAAINFPVAIFLFLAGYFTNTEKCLNDVKSYIFNRGGVRLFIPYLIWSLIYLGVSMVFGDRITLQTAFLRLVRGHAAGHLYYVVVLLQMTLITPILLLRRRENKYDSLLWLLTPAALIIVYYTGIRAGTIPWYCDTLFPLWFGFYWLGIQIRGGNERVHRLLSRIGTIPCLLLAFMINLAESSILVCLNITPSLSVSQNRIGGFVYALVLIGMLCRLPNKTKRSTHKFLEWIGDNSYAIYFSHYLVMKVVTRLLGHKLDSLWIVKFGLCFVVTFMVTVLLIESTKRIFRLLKIEKYLVYIGF